MSDWSKVTRPIPVPNEWTKPFWDAAKQGKFLIKRVSLQVDEQMPSC